MIFTTLLTAIALTTTTPTLQFTSDSVYTKDKILTFNVQEVLNESNEVTSHTLVIQENYVLGYQIYDDESTTYIDGLKIDGEWVSNWTVLNYDPNVTHTVQIKTVYSDDIMGTLAATKDGDLSRLFSEPIVLLQFVYYALAVFSILISGFGIYKSKKAKVKSANEIAEAVKNSAEVTQTKLVETAYKLIDNSVTPILNTLNTQNKDIIETLILLQSKDSKAPLAALDLLKDASAKDVSALIDSVKSSIVESIKTNTKLVEESKEVIEEISKGTYDAKKKDNGRV